MSPKHPGARRCAPIVGIVCGRSGMVESAQVGLASVLHFLISTRCRSILLGCPAKAGLCRHHGVVAQEEVGQEVPIARQ